MATKRLYLVTLLLVIGCQQAGIGADGPASRANNTITEAELDRQLKINRDALLKGSSEQIRIDAATVMLFSEDPLARKVLLDALKQSENVAARVAACKALSQTRGMQEPIQEKGDFVRPLLDILTAEEDFDRAKLAAEASLIFEYEQIHKQLEKIVTDSSLSAKARLNTIYALKLQPDMRAIFQLMKLLDDPESQVATAAEKALQSLGMPIGEDAKTRRQIIDEIKLKGREAFLRDWVIHQEARMRQLEKESDLWQKRYLIALGKIYDGVKDDAKGKFLAEHLTSPEVILRLWALEKVSQWRKGTNPQLPPELGPILVSLISDQNRDVRLKTAQLLSLMGELNSARQLVEQIKVEQDDEVRMELFVALSGACYYAFLPNSPIKIPKEIRRQALEWAAEYLSEQDAEKAQKGGEAMRKLLEQDGLTSVEVSKYLGLLLERYNQEKDKADGVLRGELLSAMAGLCAQSVYKGESTRLFGPLFEEALNDETDVVREAAVDGLIYVDNTRALKTFRKGLVNYANVRIRERLIDLAGEVGGEEDLLWLSEKIGSTAQSDPAWQVMLKIFKRSEVDVLAVWVDKFDSLNPDEGRLSDEQKLSLLEVAELKAVEKKPEMLKSIRRKLAHLYGKNAQFEQAAKYLGLLRKDAQTDEDKETILAELLNVYLRWPKVDLAAQLVTNRLLEKDLGSDSAIVLALEHYLTEQPGEVEPGVILEALAEKTPQDRPRWREQLQGWTDRFGQRSGSNEPTEAGN